MSILIDLIFNKTKRQKLYSWEIVPKTMTFNLKPLYLEDAGLNNKICGH